MYIMRRSARVAGITGIEWATEVTGVVHAAGIDASLWVGGPGSVPGTVAWSAVVEGFADWMAQTAPLMADPAYREVSARGRDLIVDIEPDVALRLVHGELGERAGVGSFIGSVRADVVPDRAADAAVFAVEIADAWSATTGLPAVVCTYAAGSMSTIEWLVRFADAAAIDEANAKLAVSESYAAKLAEGNGLFSDGQQMYARRVA